MYKVIESRVIVDEREEVTYGLRRTDGTAVTDVSPNKNEVERSAVYFNEIGVSSWNLKEIISDVLDTEMGLEKFYI
ncbi:MAG: hypothetical protein HFE51_08110 [Clostridia bacterium]|nr:hypothetical protein [Clostridia bacterium]MCI9086367.1 hypothetical protein [Clostridia bacterium]NDO18343.1 hypothetical protein [Lachnospiraceae bacterium MD329]